MNLAERLAVTAFLTDRLSAMRRDELVPAAREQMTVGERVAVKFGGRLAAWVSMPKPSKRATVTDEHKLLAWAKEHAPRHVIQVPEVVVSDALITWLEEHAPQFLRYGERVDPQWVEDALTGLKNRGYIADGNGEKVTDVPGITAGMTDPSPRVNLESDAAAVIGDAWQAGLIDTGSLLELPGGDHGAA